MNAPLAPQDLPDWMRPRRQRIDFGLLAIFALCLVVALPWITRAGLPDTLAAHEHVYRIAQVADSLQHGIFYPRWASHFHYGYGSPLFNYLAPAPYYLGGLHMLLVQSSPHTSFAILMIASIFLCGLSMFSFVRRRWGDPEGVVATLLYLLAPPLLYNLPYIQVDLPLMLAAGLFPAVLWATDLVLRSGDGRDAAILALVVALLTTAANVMGVLFLFMALLWGGWVVWQERRNGQVALLGYGIGLGLAAVYWLPALLEWGAVHWVTLEATHRQLQWGEVLRPPTLPDPAQLNPPVAAQLGLPIWGLFLVGGVFVMMEYRKNQAARLVLPFVIMGLTLFGGAVWLPNTWLDSMAKFPQLSRPDLLLPMAACGAIVGGQCARILASYHRVVRLCGLALLVGLTVGSASPLLNPPPFAPYHTVNPLTSYIQAELRGTFKGSFRNGLLLPKDTPTLPAPSLALLDSYQADQVLKVEHASRLPRGNLALLSHSPTHDTLRLDSPRPTPLEILTLNFLGWGAEFRQSPIPIQSAPQTGFIQIEIPEGRGDLRVHFGATSARLIGIVISVGSSLLLALAFPLVKKRASSAPDLPAVSWQVIGACVLAIVLLLGGRSRNLARPYLPNITPHPIIFDGGIDLLGYTLGNSTPTAGKTLDLTLFWQPARPNLPDYHIQVSLVDSTGRAVLVERHLNPGGVPSSYWKQERYIADHYALRIPSRLASGDYLLRLEVLRCQGTYTCGEAVNLQAFEPRGTPRGGMVLLPPRLEVR